MARAPASHLSPTLLQSWPDRAPSTPPAAQYNLSFTPELNLASTRRRLLVDMAQSLTARLQSVSGWAYDGDRVFYTVGRMVGAPFVEFGAAEVAAATGREIALRFKETAHHQIGTLLRDIGGGTPSDHRPTMHVLDVVLKHHNATFCRAVGKAFFDSEDETSKRPLGRPPSEAELWLGHRQSLVLTDSGLMLQARQAVSRRYNLLPAGSQIAMARDGA